MFSKSILFTAINALSLVAVLYVNYLANALPLNGYTTGELSALYPNLFVPAGFTFAIWGLIYGFQLLWVGYQILALLRKNYRALLGQRLVGLWFLLSSIANIAWIFSWHYRLPTISLAIMIGLLLILVQIYRNLGIGVRKTSHSERFFNHLPFSLYLGWISVATIANSTAVLVDWGFSGLGLPEPFYSAAMIIAAGMLGLFFLNYNVDLFYALVIAWACFGIAYKQLVLVEQSFPVISTTAIGVILILLVRYFKMRKLTPKTRAYW
jgi:hypothetical protein